MLFMMGIAKRELLKSFLVGLVMLSLIVLWKFSRSFQAATRLNVKMLHSPKKITPNSSLMGICTVMLRNHMDRADERSILVIIPSGVK